MKTVKITMLCSISLYTRKFVHTLCRSFSSPRHIRQCVPIGLQTPWGRVILEYVIVTQLVKNSRTVHYYRLPNRPPPVPILSRINPVRIPTPCSIKIHFIIILPSMHRSLEWSFLFMSTDKTSVYIAYLPRACPSTAHLFLVDLIILV